MFENSWEAQCNGSASWQLLHECNNTEIKNQSGSKQHIYAVSPKCEENEENSQHHGSLPAPPPPPELPSPEYENSIQILGSRLQAEQN